MRICLILHSYLIHFGVYTENMSEVKQLFPFIQVFEDNDVSTDPELPISNKIFSSISLAIDDNNYKFIGIDKKLTYHKSVNIT